MPGQYCHLQSTHQLPSESWCFSPARSLDGPQQNMSAPEPCSDQLIVDRTIFVPTRSQSTNSTQPSGGTLYIINWTKDGSLCSTEVKNVFKKIKKCHNQWWPMVIDQSVLPVTRTNCTNYRPLVVPTKKETQFSSILITTIVEMVWYCWKILFNISCCMFQLFQSIHM